MEKQTYYAVVGTWSLKPAQLGFHVFQMDAQTGELTPAHHYDAQVVAGFQAYNPKNHMLYVTDECAGRPGERGGGGFVRAYRVNPEDGSCAFVNEACVLMPQPAYAAVDPSGEYLLVACHSGRNFITRTLYDSKGHWTSGVLYDDAGVVLLRLAPDGSIGEVCDVALHEGVTDLPRQLHAHPHSVVPSPDGEIYYVCDKGLDRLYSYRLNREKGKLIPMAQRELPHASGPRYSVFHPAKKIWYENNENSNLLYTFSYDEESGGLKELAATELYDPDPEALTTDIVLDADAAHLYIAVRNLGEIKILDLDPETGIPSLRGSVPCPGGPRGIALSPDGKFLLAANFNNFTVTVYRVGEDGGLTDLGYEYGVPNAANAGFIF